MAHAPWAAKLVDKAKTAPTPKGARLIHHAKAVAPAPVVRTLCSILWACIPFSLQTYGLSFHSEAGASCRMILLKASSAP